MARRLLVAAGVALALGCNGAPEQPKPAPTAPATVAAPSSAEAPAETSASASAAPQASPPKLSPVRSDETVVVFPSLANWEAEKKSWRLELRVWIYEPEEDSKTRQLMTDAIAKALKVAPNAAERSFLERRLRPFLVDNESGKRLAVELDGTQLTLPESADDGHATSVVHIPAAVVPASGGPRTIRVVLDELDSRRFEAVAHFVPPKGTLVISDIDDTVKITDVTDTSKLVRRTFLEPFAFVDGLPKKYEKWVGKSGHLHFLSSSPWQLYPELSTQLSAAGFPTATFSMKRFRPGAFELDKLLSDPVESKGAELEKLARRFPTRQFVLIGDSGEKDPEVYGAFARQHPKLVTRIAIRNVTDAKPDDPRFTAAFQGISRSKWQLFDKASALD